MVKTTLSLSGWILLGILWISPAGAQDKLYPNMFPLSDIRLLDGPFKHAQDLNVETLLQYNPDRFLAPFRSTAGLSQKADKYGNWESDGLDGHTCGHYLSAMAIHYAATGKEELRKRMEYMVDELAICQEANVKRYPEWGKGYLGGVPDCGSLWPEIKSGNISVIWKYWVPWYNLHKTYAGLRDAWLYTGNEKAKGVFLNFCDWALDLTASLSDTLMEQMLGSEHGGMNEVLADAYRLSGNEKYLAAAKRFSHKQLLNPLSEGIDNLDNKHANTQVPKAVGFQRIAEVCGDEKYERAGRYFWETVSENRSLAFGGNSRREFFPPASSCIDYIHSVEGPESCNTNNMLKLTEGLFRMGPEAKYTDFYERALYNHILSTQHPEHGGYVYFTPARPRHYRVYSAPNEAMWCCVGTGMENHGKYGAFIYSQRNDSLYLNLFIPSELTWKEKGIRIIQETTFPYEEKTRLRITEGNATFSLGIRYPGWVGKGKMEIRVNGQKQEITYAPSSYVFVTRKWKKGDYVEIRLPMQTTIEELPNVPSYLAFMHGPILLGAKTGSEDLKGLLAGSGRWEHIAGGKMLPVNDAPILVEDDRSEIAAKVIPVEGKALHFTASGINWVNSIRPIEFEPFFSIHDSRYMIYWMGLTQTGYQHVLDSIALLEAEKLRLEERTVDHVQPGQQQPEADHFMKAERSGSGNYMNEFWRDARDGGFFSYELRTEGESNLSLMIRYWGNENSPRTFELRIDNERLATENTREKWKVQEFRNVTYPIPVSMLEGKKKITLSFHPLPGNTAGGIFYVRLIRNAK